MMFTQSIRSDNEQSLITRRESLRDSGVVCTPITLEVGTYVVYTFSADLNSDTAQRLARGDDRWSIANQFFQAAENAESKRGWYALLASDWSSFGYRKHSLEEYLAIEHERQGR